jgi:CRP-like cAMP-binding protein
VLAQSAALWQVRNSPGTRATQPEAKKSLQVEQGRVRVASESAASAIRPKAPLNQKLPVALPLLAREAATLLDLMSVARTVRAGQEIVSEGKRCTAVFLITDGIAMRYRILRDGQRQILNLLLPGNFAGVTSCRFETALYSIKTLTETTISPLPLNKLLGLLETEPRLAAKLFWSFACETAILGEHLITVSRRSATERIAHFLLELLTRLQEVGLADERSYRVPLTQEMISDALGLSIPYVNRVLQQLRQAGLVRIKDQRVVIDDLDELAALADFERTYLKPLSIGELMPEPG